MRIKIENSCYKTQERFIRALLDIHIVLKKCTKVFENRN